MHLNWENIKKDLRNIFLCSYYRIIGQLTYPSCILPRTKYIHLINFSSLLETQAVFILRRSEKNCEETFNRLGDNVTLREDSIEPIDIPNMSLNLMGGKFLEKHLKYIPDGKAEAVRMWNGRSKIYLINFLKSYKVEKKYCPIYFDCNAIFEQYFVYGRRKAKELNTELKLFYEKIGKKMDYDKEIHEFIGHTSLSHVPTNLNYWHVEFNLIDYRKEVIKRKNTNWIEDLGEQIIKNILTANAYATVPIELPVIPERYYFKQRA